MSSRDKSKIAVAGEYIGLGFQLADDLLDVEGDENEVGKKLKKDMMNQSPNSVYYFGIEEVKNLIDKYYGESISILKETDIKSESFLNLVRMMFYRRK